MLGIVLITAVLLSSVTAQVPEPAEQNRILACGNLDASACQVAKGCRLCRSRYGQSQCFSANQVSSLPGGVWPCRYEHSQTAASSCDNLGKDQCTASGSCSWCESAAVGNACYTKDDAKKLPSAIFSCTNAAYNATSGPPRNATTGPFS